jgi:hypothetical protein
VLDSGTFSAVIYIWYEGGERKPPLVRLTFRPHPSAPGTLKYGAEGADRRSDGGDRVSVPDGSHGSRTGRARQDNPDEGGDKAQWQRRPRAGRRRQRRSVKLTSPARKKGGGRRPLFNFQPLRVPAGHRPNSSSRPTRSRDESHPTARSDRRRPCRSRLGQRPCTGHRGAVAASG